ncbi:MAG: ATP synthase F1 subunit gamma [Oligoflexales bacterium]
MPTLKDTKRRITSVKSTQKITRAMKLVSSAKYARANRELLKSKPYREAFSDLFTHVASVEGKQPSPLMEVRNEKKSLLIVVTTDRGLCGGLNSNLLKKAKVYLDEKHNQGVTVDVALWGRRAQMGFSGEKNHVLSSELGVLDRPSFDFVSTQATRFRKLFEEEKYDRIDLVYPSFRNVVSQTPKVVPIFPVVPPEANHAEYGVEPLAEPDPQTLFEDVLSKHVVSILLGVLQEGAASEHAARMTAMDNATNNAEEVVRALTIQYNRARQAAITKELIEITSGAEAL